jgi:hypothetical protein
MSHLDQYALVIATFISGGFLAAYLTSLQNQASAAVLIGVMRGVPMSNEMRWIWLWQVFLGMAIFILLVDFMLFFAFFKIARWVDESVAPLAHLATAAWGFAFVAQLLFGTSAFFKQASVLRQTTRG